MNGKQNVGVINKIATNINDKVALAAEISKYAHEGQIDKGGNPYYFHPKYVASRVYNPNEKIVALLHDVLEDTNFPIMVLEALFDTKIIDALKILIHEEGVPYMEYIDLVSRNSLAKRVKIEDLKHNMQLARIPYPTRKDIERVEKYKKALNYLENS